MVNMAPNQSIAHTLKSKIINLEPARLSQQARLLLASPDRSRWLIPAGSALLI